MTALLVASALPVLRASLPLQETRGSATDLAVTGELTDLPTNAVRYVRHADLAALPTSQLKLTGEFVPGEQTVTVVYLKDVWAALPKTRSADTLLATCSDGYASVFRVDFIATYQPFLILEINGAKPEAWPPPGLSFNPGPYVISVSSAVVPAVAQLLDAGHKRPWGVNAIEVANYQTRFAALRPATHEPSAGREMGREIWINSCASCHSGPPNTFGGTKSERPFAIVAFRAKMEPVYFMRYVRDPKSVSPEARMEPHPHYSDEQLSALISFITSLTPSS
ncbi:MAG: cytochrome c [Opitutus sp.]